MRFDAIGTCPFTACIKEPLTLTTELALVDEIAGKFEEAVTLPTT